MLTESFSSRSLRISQSNTARIVLFLFVIALIIRAAYLYVGPGLNAPFEGDEIEYHNFATALSERGKWEVGSDQSTRPPVTPFVLAIVYSVTGPDPTAARVAGVFISALVPALLFLVAMQYTKNQRIALLSSLAFVVYPPAIFYAPRILTENLGSLLVIAALGAFIWGAEKKTTTAAIITGIIWAMLGLNRSVYIVTPGAFLVIQLLIGRFGITDWSWNARMWAIGLAAFLMALSPWIIRNAIVHHAFVPTTTRLGHLLLMTNGTLEDDQIKSGTYFKNPELYAISAAGTTEIEVDAIKRRLAFDELKRNWRLLPEPIFNRAKNFWTFRPDPYDSQWTRNDLIMLMIWMPVLIFSLLSSFVRSWKHHWPVLTFVLIAFALTLPFWAEPRFRFPVDALLILGATIGFVELMGAIKPRLAKYSILSRWAAWLSGGISGGESGKPIPKAEE